MTSPHQEGGRELSTWKEIAAHLGVSVRTVQMWEQKLGLPIRRLPGPKGRVSANAAELDEWKCSGGVNPPAPEAEERRRWPRYAATAGLLAILVGGVAAWRWLADGPPASAAVESNALVVRDAGRKELWRKTFPYRLEVDAYQPDGETRTKLWLGSLDGGKSVSVLFAPIPHPAVWKDAEPLPLICYTASGEERWRYTLKRTVQTSTRTYGPNYRVDGFGVIPAEGKTPVRIVAIVLNQPDEPCQVAMLSASGQLLREYWHSGFLQHMEIADLDGDGKPEIYLAGVNNGRHAAELLALDPDRLTGAAEEGVEYQLLGFPAPVERARVLLPRTCLNEQFHPYNAVYRLLVSPDGVRIQTKELLVGVNQADVFHVFRADLTGPAAQITDAYRSALIENRRRIAPDCTAEKPLERAHYIVTPPSMHPAT